MDPCSTPRVRVVKRLTLALYASSCLFLGHALTGCLEAGDGATDGGEGRQLNQGFFVTNQTAGPVEWTFRSPRMTLVVTTAPGEQTPVYIECTEGEIITFATAPEHQFPTGKASCGRGSVTLEVTP